ncbi:MAG: 2-(1,2-epoxy-1,2-dihydrophenyl)acetyl-CoA isomerase [Deltaproteobacteria bacterium]|nr:2-(1,2-epoxy-1,2-dihydrophenyl)acetyl-CoA isomerase [Deltaproteobacteria bacterium]
MSTSHLLYDITDRVAVITLNRPDAMNAFSDTMREDLLRMGQEAASDTEVRCVMITGAGRAFCAGGDIASMAELQAKADTSVVERRMTLGSQVVHCLRAMPKPVIAAVNGAAAGAGINLALACDIRLATTSARFSESFVKIGLVPDWGGTYLLTQIVGTGKALELMLSGDRIDADEALRLGLVNRVFPDDTFREDALRVAQQFAAGPSATLAHIKRAVYIGATGTLAEALTYEVEAQRQVFLSNDAREGMRAFLEKRAPRFS